MPTAALEITPCPPDRSAEALALVLSELAPSLRREVSAAALPGAEDPPTRVEGLYIALRGESLVGAAWGQRQPGNTAVFWPPQRNSLETAGTARRLGEAVVRELDKSAVGMSQVLLPSQDDQIVPLLKTLGFRHLADLLYLSCEAERFSPQGPVSREIEFVPYDEANRDRLSALVERTYEDTHDCATLNGTRHMDDVIAGYQSTGVFRPENWLIVRAGGRDAGVLLLADHPAARHWELVYMGLVPEARGRGWGKHIAQHAQQLARAAQVERVVLAVDAANEPALRMYQSAGFESWDRRTVFVRFPADSQTKTH